MDPSAGAAIREDPGSAAAAAADASTSAIAFLPLAIFRTGMVILTEYSKYTNVVHGVLIPSCGVFSAVLRQKTVWPGFC